MLIPILLLILGFIFLVGGGNWLVGGASSVAKRLKVSPLMIGLTIVAFGTSAPELMVNILAGLNGNSDIAIGNILGSNIVNIILILGVAAVIYPLKVGSGTVWKEIPLSILATIVVFFAANDLLLDGAKTSIITRSEGLVLLAFFAIFVYYTFGIAKVEGDDGEDIKKMPVWLSVVYVILGIFFLGWGGDLVVRNAVEISRLLGLSESVIGLTVVAIGTSLPELVTSVMAAIKKETDIAIGNIVGSNIFNLLWILGLSAVINPLKFNIGSNFDLIIAGGASILLFTFMFHGRKHTLDRWQGGIFISLYIAYLAYLVIGALD